MRLFGLDHLKREVSECELGEVWVAQQWLGSKPRLKKDRNAFGMRSSVKMNVHRKESI